jgi:hypothetical protein
MHCFETGKYSGSQLRKTKTCKLQPMNEFGCFLKRFFFRARQSFETREKKFVGQQKMDSPNTQVE